MTKNTSIDNDKLHKEGNPSIGVIIPTYQGAKHLSHCLPYIMQSSLKPRVLIIDSSSNDNTIEIAKQWGAETIVIPQNEFNHGLTREIGRQHLKTDIVVMMTQDAYATSPQMLEHLVRPLIEKRGSVSYARQLPHLGAGFFESFPRYFNYPEKSHIRGIDNLSEYGVYTFFCSNSCAAYLNSALDEVGGFPSVLFGEDTAVVAKLLNRHHKIAYVANAEVRHSHHYSLLQEFKRHFDIGLARQEYGHLISAGGKDSKRGTAYAKEMFKQLVKKHPEKIPYSILQLTLKWLGYKIGQASTNAPVWFKRKLSSQSFYWNSNYFIKKK
ncbi:MAG: glycosyltransferase [Parachlamydiaceae bacterium]|nr:glycosyltransferase [Parachlamydiaceae bacterium]